MAVKKSNSPAKQVKTEQTESPKEDMVFSWANYKWMLLGVLIIVVGFVLMAGGGSGDPAVFDSEAIFSWRRISIYAVCGWLISS